MSWLHTIFTLGIRAHRPDNIFLILPRKLESTFHANCLHCGVGRGVAQGVGVVGEGFCIAEKSNNCEMVSFRNIKRYKENPPFPNPQFLKGLLLEW